MNLTASVVLAISAAFGVNQPAALVQLPAPMPEVQTVEEYVKEYFADVPVMVEIAKCESQFRQFAKDGKVLKNANSSAVGVFQIMSSIHSSFADEKLGLDVYSLQGNAAYARYLYEKQGTTPWDASKACWGKSKDASVVAINKN